MAASKGRRYGKMTTPTTLLEVFDIDGKTLGSMPLQWSRWKLVGAAFVNVDCLDIKAEHYGVVAGLRIVVDGQIRVGGLTPSSYGEKISIGEIVRVPPGQFEFFILNAAQWADDVEHFRLKSRSS